MIQAGGTSMAPQPPERYDQECAYRYEHQPV